VARESGTALHWSVRELRGTEHGWEARAEATTEDGWHIRVVFADQAGMPVLRDLHVAPVSRRKIPAGGLTSRRLRSLSLAPAFPLLQRFADRVAPDPADRVHFKSLIEGDLRPRPGRRRISPELLARIAVRYAELYESGEKALIPRLADEFQYSTASMRGLVYRARREDYLTPTRPGRPGGWATDRARGLLGSDAPGEEEG
jgi:hypothetical protein